MASRLQSMASHVFLEETTRSSDSNQATTHSLGSRSSSTGPSSTMHFSPTPTGTGGGGCGDQHSAGGPSSMMMMMHRPNQQSQPPGRRMTPPPMPSAGGPVTSTSMSTASSSSALYPIATVIPGAPLMSSQAIAAGNAVVGSGGLGGGACSGPSSGHNTPRGPGGLGPLARSARSGDPELRSLTDITKDDLVSFSDIRLFEPEQI
ncbi:unnamed protein product [Protopolystoma xenopodis]|uniref:Uncharacterized protein n=1 Tax=Protopolystoma xenopodis TaxID=117903 RepID=A0A3S5AIV1_9PLAT|nr:unnamed protein product [Protopolystoma xenopodis]